nr:transmembrane protein 128-like [Ciona intestinalis]|eukprot:XP_002123696.3 transmembrane protein 128-like [Ciona intestinalis]
MDRLDNPTTTMSATKPKPVRKWDNILWIILSVITLYYSDVISVVIYNTDISGIFFCLAIAFGAMALTVCIHCVFWGGIVRGMDCDGWEKLYPLGVPIATGTAVASAICWNFTLWSVYGIKTPVIVFILTMGFFMLLSILPSTPKKEEPRFYTKIQHKRD